MTTALLNYYAFIFFFCLTLFSCKELSEDISNPSTKFRKVDSALSNITFANDIVENDTLTYFKFPYIYMGGGVAIADINNDGLSDIFLTGNAEENKLYLNKGGMQFEDISQKAGVSGDDRWYSGVTATDINNDGWIDLYLSVSGKYGDRRNQLLVNNGDLTFSEAAAEYGINDASNTIQSTFFDYDGDGDLDLFVANYPLVPISMGNMFYKEKMDERKWEECGHLYENRNSNYVDVTADAGILNFGLTLGVVATDINNDGHIDLYLSNDFNVPDYLYLNNGDGSFTNSIEEALGHTSMFGMGIDASDFNNDGLQDLVQVDMTPEDYVRAKVNMASMSPETFYQGIEIGFHYQYMQNSLQENRGISKDGIPIMSEVSRLSNMSLTDWSWSALFADLDNDGWKDVYITNGNKRDVNDNDVNLKTNPTSFRQFSKISIDDYISQPISNYAFKNNGLGQFEKFGKLWNLDFKGFSNGVAYGDLDNDGDLDLLINNIDDKAVLYENNTKGRSYLKVDLLGPKSNVLGLGARVYVRSDDKVQMQELTLTRGFQSSVEPILHFGLDQSKTIGLRIVWPDGLEQELDNVAANQVINIDHKNAEYLPSKERNGHSEFIDITSKSGIGFQHQEDLFDDFKFEPLLPYKYSMMGPAIAVGDINKDGLDDFYAGNAGGQRSALYVQNKESKFQKISGPWELDLEQEDGAVIFEDFDNDGDQDIYVASHGNQFQDLNARLYLNTPTGFRKSTHALPLEKIGSCVIAAADYDKDGRTDLFIGGRNVPGQYALPATSQLLRNKSGQDETLTFENVTALSAKGLADLGMVTDARWADLDADGWLDLIVAGEWMPVTIFQNKEGRLVDATKKFGLHDLKGWWYAVHSVDVDQDGDLDLLAGNLGLNQKYKASKEDPFGVYANDFDENGKMDIVLSYNKGGKEMPLRGRECSSQQVPAIAKRFKTFRSFAQADLQDIYGEAMLENSMQHTVNTFAHYWFENENGVFTEKHLLPIETQYSSINAVESMDYNGDEFPDLIIGGNLYSTEVETPRLDAGLVLVLVGSSNGFEAIAAKESDLLLRGDVKHISAIKKADNGNAFLLGINNDSLKLIEFNKDRQIGQ